MYPSFVCKNLEKCLKKKKKKQKPKIKNINQNKPHLTGTNCTITGSQRLLS